MNPGTALVSCSCTLVGLFLSVASPCLAAVNVTIDPSVVTNDFVGKVTVTVTGLPTGQTIRIEKWGDVNLNSVVDGNDFVTRSFTVTDGQLPLLAGCTNLNVVGDADASPNGQVHAEMFFPTVDQVLDATAAHYLVRVSDPAGSFTPVTNTFELRQKVYPQGVTGKALAADTGLPMTNALVILIPQNSSVGVGTAADAAGNFTVYSPPGSYITFVLYKGYITDRIAGSVTVNSNAFVTKNLTNAAGTWTVSGNTTTNVAGDGQGMFFDPDPTTPGSSADWLTMHAP